MKPTETASGLILRTRPLTETSLIVQWLTRDLGRIATVAKGARRPKSTFAGKLDLFYWADLSFNRSRTSELHLLREVSVRETHPALRQSMGALQQACYAAALVEQVTETETPLEGIADLVFGFVDFLSQAGPPPELVFAFELKFLAELGLGPELGTSSLKAETRGLAESFVTSNWDWIAARPMTPAQRSELSQYLRGFITYHLGRVPRGRDLALES
ncbi:MAG TPA: DNA repair protein RecO [Clostridia bacterium]|nr:DNA repair protein RecO [Clostridia bacterium]